MNILSIETSCDETAISVIKAEGNFPKATYEILGNALFSQIDLHAPYGGVFPTLAKREHASRIIPLMISALAQAELLHPGQHQLSQVKIEKIKQLLIREPDTNTALLEFTTQYEKPELDLITVTIGPGLEPALWVGVNLAKALAVVWGIKVVPVNHMEGHILASIYNVEIDNALAPINFPALALLISGGHTEMILIKTWGQYEKIGVTRDDAVGEAFDKTARLLGLPYPGGAELSRLARLARQQNLPPYTKPLPRPMINSGDFDFSFSGLKTAVLYAIGDNQLSESETAALARDFEEAVTDVLVKKTSSVAETYNIRSLIVGGGVSANSFIKQSLTTHFLENYPDCEVYFPNPGLSTDNSIMIALAGHAHTESAGNASAISYLKADGNKSL